MRSSWRIRLLERAQPWLGTLVRIRVSGAGAPAVHQAIDQAFEEIGMVHRLMSFHSAESDVSRVNQHAAKEPVQVHPWTSEVLRCALTMSVASEGCFDVSIGGDLAAAGWLPGSKARRSVGHLSGDWRDIKLLEDWRVSLARPLWLDLGGIAKGYAVDRAVGRLQELGITQGSVNAGGDLRVFGPESETVALRLDHASPDRSAAIELTDGSAASSSGYLDRAYVRGKLAGPHLHGVDRTSAPTDRFACVLAEECIWADALTKVVLATGKQSRDLLRRFRASAHMHDAQGGWLHLDGECGR